MRQVSMEAAQRALKDLVFERWLDEACEPRADTLKSVGLVDFFLPFLPLERQHLVQLFDARLHERADAMRRAEGAELAWAPEVTEFLTDKVRPPGLPSVIGAGSWNNSLQDRCGKCGFYSTFCTTKCGMCG